METLTAQANADRMLDRLGAERQTGLHVHRALRQARFFWKAMQRAIDADNVADAQKWAALAESASGRADKLVRSLHGLIADRERRADAERLGRLADALPGTGVGPRPKRGAA